MYFDKYHMEISNLNWVSYFIHSDKYINISNLASVVNFMYFKNLPVIVSCEREFEELLDIDEAVGVG